MGYLNESKMIVAFANGKLSGKTFTGIVRHYKREGFNQTVVESVIDRLVGKGKIIKRDGRFYLAGYSEGGEKSKRTKKVVTLTGAFRCNEKGYGFVTVEGDKDYFIRTEKMGQALNGDTVVIRPVYDDGSRDLAEIVEVVKRGQTRLVGTVFIDGGLFYVRPDDRAYFADIYIADDRGVPPGDKVLVEILRFPKNRCPEGRILKRIGKQFEFDAERDGLIFASGVQTEFSAEAMERAKNIPSTVSEQDIIGRRDLRDRLIFTIDGESARDFDDAVSLEVENGVYKLGVHIADVTHYVGINNDPIGKEAFERGTSIYLPDRVIPMLPFELSNGICSLNEGVDRLTVTVDTTFDSEGNILKTEIYKSVIKSTYRLTYTLVQAIIDGDEKTRYDYDDICETVDNMNVLRALLEKKRTDAGYIDLSIKESEIRLDGEKVEVGVHKSTLATRLIEQFMITANEAVAQYLYRKGLPCVYRVHEKPLEDKAEQLSVFLRALGIKVNLKKGEFKPKDIQKLLLTYGQTRFAAVVNKVVLRSMQKARYSPENLGHFGLASECYCHFTSPIRRYPDLAVHTILKSALDGEIEPLIDLYADFSEKTSEKSSAAERVADDLERSVDDLYKAKYMSDKVGEEFDGIISGVLSSGFFVELENTCEGFVPIETLAAGTYVYDKENFSLSSARRSYRIGDRVRICVMAADICSRRVDFCLAK